MCYETTYVDIFRRLVTHKKKDNVPKVDFPFIVRSMKSLLFGPLFGINPVVEISSVLLTYQIRYHTVTC
jgi:hypothetical protein